MLGTYFYHEVIRKTIIGFGTLFNNMEVRHQNSDGTTVDIKRVPLAYGPAAKFIARLEHIKIKHTCLLTTFCKHALFKLASFLQDFAYIPYLKP